MNVCRNYRGSWTILISGVLSLSVLLRSAFATEETFPTLEVGAHVYTNVTVTTKAKNYIFIHHSTGMENIKVADLPQEKWQQQFATAFEKVRTLDSKLCGAFLGGILLIHLLFCYCCLLICQKAGQEPGMLIWLPILQVFPLLRAARMS